MTYVDPEFVRPGGSGYDQTADHADKYENLGFEYGDGGRDIKILPPDAGVAEGKGGTVMRGLQKDNPWEPNPDYN